MFCAALVMSNSGYLKIILHGVKCQKNVEINVKKVPAKQIEWERNRASKKFSTLPHHFSNCPSPREGEITFK